MKRLLLLALLPALLWSCKKENEAEPKQTITYTVKCVYCTVEVNDNQFSRQSPQSFIVNGQWSYTFDNIKLDSAYLRVIAPTAIGAQKVQATIRTTDNRSKLMDLVMPIDGYDKSISLGLR